MCKPLPGKLDKISYGFRDTVSWSSTQLEDSEELLGLSVFFLWEGLIHKMSDFIAWISHLIGLFCGVSISRGGRGGGGV